MEENSKQKIYTELKERLGGYLHKLINDRRKLIRLFVLFFALVFAYLLLFTAPINFPTGSVMEITSGQSLQLITTNLRGQKIIRSELIFRSLAILYGGEKKMIAGDYLLAKREGTFSLVRRLVNGQFGIDTIRVTIPEGWNIYQIADYLEKNILEFNKKEFLSLAQSKEGYLFPDTYFVSRSIDSADLIKMMEDNYTKKASSIQDKIKSSGHSEKDIVTMASILEGEALPEDRSTVAGILWRRLEIGMALQVDSTFSYVNGKNTYELTLDDLKIDSLYNTYKYTGLPPTPINNPGLDAMLSALSPIKTKYLYFLTEKDGTIHYARTFEEHKRNKELYLD